MALGRSGTVAALGLAQTLAWASSYYLPAMLAAPMARELGVAMPTVFAAFSVALIVSALLGPRSGRAIDLWGGRPVLMATNLVFALGLIGLGFAQGPVSLFAAWVVLGIGMGSGLYEAAFAALVRLYGKDSRNTITGITLVAGFASTVGWPLSTLLEAHIGWRGACFAWAALHLLLGLPLNALLPRAPALHATSAPPQAADIGGRPSASLRATMALSFVFAATGFISTAMAAHLPRLLQAAGVSLAGAVLVGALIGPSQVGARLLEFGLLRKVHPVRSARLAAAMHPLGVAVFVIIGAPAAAVFGILHGAGNGILTIAKGTLPLVLFGPHGYGHRQGLLMVPARITQALSPWLFGLALDRWGDGALAVSAVVGLLALLALCLLPSVSPEATITETCTRSS
ncbi:MFS transporter [Aquabacterium sp.]|uniref:MFS transporter n=1 Tax=Aquabacterium sp. TaxID=1872578 RepID=UPI002BF2D85D|nr:MFS transporter [Aquabacterium sp.]HSW04445.1 MFS transporter [Aquabacterium sp.]